METQLHSPVFRPLYSPYRIEQSWACTVLPPLERFLRDESRTGATKLLSAATRLLTALGQKQTCAVQNAMSALPPIADMCGATQNVRLVPMADIAQIPGLPNRRRYACDDRNRTLPVPSRSSHGTAGKVN